VILVMRLAGTSVAMVVLASAGCGGPATDTTSSARDTTLNRAGLVAGAEAICKRLDMEYREYVYTTTASIARFAPRVAADEQIGVLEMRRLVPPASMVSDWNQLADIDEAIANDTDKLGEYAEEDNLKAAAPLYSAERRHHREALALATRDGFKACVM
jgi:hypothetical protein